MSEPASTLSEALDRSRAAVAGVINGDPRPIHALYSNAEDVTLGNPFGPFVRGRQAVEETTAAAAARYRDGELRDFERLACHESAGLACVVEIERFAAKLGDSSEPAEVSIRVTSVFRLEDRSWRLVHRHADPITTARDVASLTAG